MGLPRLHATAVDCAHELINGEYGIIGDNGKGPLLAISRANYKLNFELSHHFWDTG